MKLPIDALLPRIIDAPGNLVIEAPPGAGKTTRVPPALLMRGRGEVLVLEPRRLAVRMAARHVARDDAGRREACLLQYVVVLISAAGNCDSVNRYWVTGAGIRTRECRARVDESRPVAGETIVG